MNIQRLFLNLCLALIIPAFIIQTALAIFPEPRWEQFNKELPNYWYDTASVREKKTVGEEQQINNRKFTVAQQKQQKNLFLAVAPTGIILIIIGALSGLPYLGSALIGGGIFSIFRSYFLFNCVSPDGQWFNVSMKWRALVFGIGLILFLAVEIYFIIKDRKATTKKKKKKTTPKVKRESLQITPQEL